MSSQNNCPAQTAPTKDFPFLPTLKHTAEVMRSAHNRGSDRLMSIWQDDLQAVDAAIAALEQVQVGAPAEIAPADDMLPAETVAQYFLDNRPGIDLKYLPDLTDLVRRARNDTARPSPAGREDEIVSLGLTVEGQAIELERAGREIERLKSKLQSRTQPAAAPTIDDVPSCGQENDYRRARPSQSATPAEKGAKAALEQIAIVCTDNMDRSCDHRMALDFVRQIANDYLDGSSQPESSAQQVALAALQDWYRQANQLNSAKLYEACMDLFPALDPEKQPGTVSGEDFANALRNIERDNGQCSDDDTYLSYMATASAILSKFEVRRK